MNTVTAPRRRGRSHLGPRVVVTAGLYASDLAIIDARRGRTPRSTFLAPILTAHVNRTDLLTPGQPQLPLAATPGAPTHATVTGSVHHVTVRVHPDVRDAIEVLGHAAGIAQSDYNADVIRDYLGIAHPTPRPEGLPLAM